MSDNAPRLGARFLLTTAGVLAVLAIAGPAAGSTIVVSGSKSADTVVVTPRGVDTDGDGTREIQFARTGTPDAVRIDGGAGADVIDASRATVGIVIDGGPGDDTITGSGGSDTLIGGPGADVVDGGAELLQTNATCEVQIDVSTGQPAVVGFGGDTLDLSTETGPFTVDLDPNEQHPGQATGPDGSVDVLQNVEHVIGSSANDTISGDDAGNALQGGPGDDTIAGDSGDDCMLGNDGNDTFDENEGVSTAQGGSGTTNGADAIFGNAGADDTVTYSARTTRVVVYLEAIFGGDGTLNDSGDAEDGADLDGDAFADDDEGDDVFLDVENVVTGSGNDVIWAAFRSNRADNELTGNAGNDKLEGGAGNDTFHEGTTASGADDMDGGTGTDTCDYSQRSAPVIVSFDAADNDGEAGEGDNCGGVVDLAIPAQFGEVSGDEAEGGPQADSDVENVLGGSGNDVLTGDEESNVLTGNAGNDTLSGRGGTDTLLGGDGDDVLDGGPGNDSLDGGAGTDVIDFGSGGGVVVNLAAGTASGQGNDTFVAGENVSGSPSADTLRGTTGNDVLNGRGGNDAIQALAGDDVVNGGSGADELNGGEGNDAVNGGSGADALRGAAGDDTLQGGPGRDTLLGQGGDDTLSGNAGRDDHRGGPGFDRCIPGPPGLGAGDTATGCES